MKLHESSPSPEGPSYKDQLDKATNEYTLTWQQRDAFYAEISDKLLEALQGASDKDHWRLMKDCELAIIHKLPVGESRGLCSEEELRRGVRVAPELKEIFEPFYDRVLRILSSRIHQHTEEVGGVDLDTLVSSIEKHRSVICNNKIGTDTYNKDELTISDFGDDNFKNITTDNLTGWAKGIALLAASGREGAFEQAFELARPDLSSLLGERIYYEAEDGVRWRVLRYAVIELSKLLPKSNVDLSTQTFTDDIPATVANLYGSDNRLSKKARELSREIGYLEKRI